MRLENCLICGAKVEEYLDLGIQPLANSYHRGEALPRFPLGLAHCLYCDHHQLIYSVDPKLMFENYLYVSDTSSTLVRYFEWLKSYIGSPKSVLEIACNSGCFLEMFQKDPNCETVMGCDPAKNLKEISKKRGLNVLDAYWNLRTAKELNRQFEAVVAINVLPHVPDPVEFMLACKEACSGKIYIQTSHCDIFQNGEWDNIYHEHTSYFTEKSLKKLAERTGMDVAIRKVPIHSMSFLAEFTFPVKLGGNLEETKRKVLALNDRKMIAYGASAKGNTALNYFGLKLSYIVDDNPMKWDYFTPGMNIPIKSPKVLKDEKEDLYILMTAWNFKEEITEKLRILRPQNNDILVYYVPNYYTTSLYPVCG